MDGKQLFKKYYNRLRKEGIIKALICSFIVGFAVNFLSAFVTWMVGFKGFWLPIVLGVFAIVVCTPIFYRKKFRPTTKEIARRIDKLGLEERIITMTELAKEQSYIALRQREDAEEKLQTVNAKHIRFRFSAAAVAAAAVAVVLGVSMTTVTTLSAQGIIPDGSSWFEDIKPEPPVEYLTISYRAAEGGSILGEEEQTVARGGNSETVVATAEDGWRFDGWSDGASDPSRTDVNVQEEFVVTAQFVRVDEIAPAEEEGDQPDDPPVEMEPSGPPNAGGTYQDYNQVIDGETHYKEIYQEYYDLAMELLASDSELTPEQREIIEAYFDYLL